jgi:hypothetical protein
MEAAKGILKISKIFSEGVIPDEKNHDVVQNNQRP